MRKLVLAVLVLLFLGAAAPQLEPSHPISHIHPIDENFDMEGQGIYNLSHTSFDEGFNISEYEITTQSQAPILSYEDSVPEWRFHDDINMTHTGDGDNYEIRNFFAEQCEGEQVVAQVHPNGSYLCQDVGDLSEDRFVEVEGDTMTGALNLSSSNLIQPGEIHTDGSDISIRDTSVPRDMMVFQEGGPIRVPSPAVDLEGNELRNVESISSDSTGDLELITDQEGGSIVLYDDVDDEQLLEASQSGELTVASGNLEIENNRLSGNNGFLSFAGETQLRSESSDDIVLQASDSSDIARFTEDGDVEIPDGDLDLPDGNISSYFENNICPSNRAVGTIHENGTIECTPEIQFSVDTENLSETLEAGNVANQSIDMSGENIEEIGKLLLDSDSGIHIGNSSTETGDENAVAVGRGADASGVRSVAIGLNSQTREGDDVVIGPHARSTATGGQALAIGYEAHSGQIGGTSIGPGASAENYYSLATGSDAETTGWETTAVGAFTNVTEDYGTAVGVGSKSTAEGAVAIGYEAVAPNQYEATFGNLEEEELDVNITGDTTIHGSDGLDMRQNPIQNIESLRSGESVNTIAFDSNNNVAVPEGDLGIGVENPTETLDVDGSSKIESGGTTQEVRENGDVVVTLGE